MISPMRTYATAGWRTRIINISAARNSFATSCSLTAPRPPAGASGWAKNGWWPCGTFASNGSPCGAQPRVRVMFALAEVSSRKTAVQAPTCPGTSSKTGACGPRRDDRARRRTASFLKLSRASWTIRQTVTSLVTMPRSPNSIAKARIVKSFSCSSQPRIQAWCGVRERGCWRPCGSAAALPVCRSRGC